MSKYDVKCVESISFFSGTKQNINSILVKYLKIICVLVPAVGPTSGAWQTVWKEFGSLKERLNYKDVSR